MVRSISSNNYAALQARLLVARDFITFIVRTRGTGEPVVDSYWSDVGTVSAPVVDPNTGLETVRTFVGSGTLISISNIALVSNLTVQNATVNLSQVIDRVNDLVRTYDCKQGQVQVFRGMFSSDTRQLVDPAIPRFVGTIDDILVVTPKEGEDGRVEVTCTSNTQEMTRSNPDTRSDASQRLRSTTDNFLVDAAVVGTWNQSWGKSGGPIRAAQRSSSSLPGAIGGIAT